MVVFNQVNLHAVAESNLTFDGVCEFVGEGNVVELSARVQLQVHAPGYGSVALTGASETAQDGTGFVLIPGRGTRVELVIDVTRDRLDKLLAWVSGIPNVAKQAFSANVALPCEGLKDHDLAAWLNKPRKVVDFNFTWLVNGHPKTMPTVS